MTTTPAPTDLDVLRKLAHTAQDWAEYGHPSDPNWHGARTLIKTVPALLDELAKTRAELDETKALLAEYVDDEPCHIDHNGYCQEHGLSSTRRGGCRNVRAKQVLEANPATTAEPADEPKATCHLPVQNGEPCGLLICRKHGCRVAPNAKPAAS